MGKILWRFNHCHRQSPQVELSRDRLTRSPSSFVSPRTYTHIIYMYYRATLQTCIVHHHTQTNMITRTTCTSCHPQTCGRCCQWRKEGSHPCLVHEWGNWSEGLSLDDVIPVRVLATSVWWRTCLYWLFIYDRNFQDRKHGVVQLLRIHRHSTHLGITWESFLFIDFQYGPDIAFDGMSWTMTHCDTTWSVTVLSPKFSYKSSISDVLCTSVSFQLKLHRPHVIVNIILDYWTFYFYILFLSILSNFD